jgi:glycosyltransferase involved in cell wall biosynthesis
MKVLIVSYFFPPCTSGAAAVMYDLCKPLPRNAYHVVTVRKEFCFAWGAYDEDYVVDCSISRLPVYTNSTASRTIFFFLAVLHGLWLVERKKVDSIFAVYPHFTDVLAAYILSKLTGKPLVVQMHDSFSEKKTGLSQKIWQTIEKRIFSSASRVLVMTQPMKNYYSKKNITNTIVFPTPIDLTKISETKPIQTELPSQPLKIVYTGSVYAVNERTIRAFLETAKQIRDLKIVFAVAQTQNLRQDLKEYLKDVNVGSLSKKKCIELQRSADVLLVVVDPGIWYTSMCYPCKISEYMLAGKPILALSPKGYYTEHFIKKYELGLVVTEFSAEKIMDAIEELRDYKKRERMSQNALLTVRLFDSENLSRQFCKIMEAVVSAKNKRTLTQKQSPAR